MVDLELKFPEGFFDEEVRNGFTVTKERKEIWAVELDLLNKLQKVCEKHNLKFYLDSGSLLGAVRSKGMIPWDNDIDVVMPRRDYDILVHNYYGDFETPYFLQSFYSDKDYYRGHAQLRNSDTTGILMYEYKNVPFNQGIFLDIFVLDDVPLDTNVESQLKKKLEDSYTILLKERRAYLPCKNNLQKIVRESRTLLYRTIFGNEKKLYSSVENKLRETQNGNYYDKLFYRLNGRQDWKKIDKSYYDSQLMWDFENLKCPIPSGYKEILTIYYGKDYMTPVQEPNAHDGSGLILDPNKPYTEYLKN